MKGLKVAIRSMVIVTSILLVNSQNVNAEWRTDNGDKWWYSKENHYSIGWELINNVWYYFGNDGYMKTGWVQYDGKWYYLYSNGSMAKNTTIDGYTLASDGAWISTREKVYDKKNYEIMAENYIVSKGYEIISKKGETDRYILDKNIIYGSAKSAVYAKIWGLQMKKPENYFGKEIYVYGFTVKNHPLEKIYDVNTNIYIMICKGEIIGGFSYPDDDIVGSNYSIDGKTLEEVSGMSYEQWSAQWEVRYKN